WINLPPIPDLLIAYMTTLDKLLHSEDPQPNVATCPAVSNHLEQSIEELTKAESFMDMLAVRVADLWRDSRSIVLYNLPESSPEDDLRAISSSLRALGAPNSEKFSHRRLGAKSRSHYRPIRICFDLEATAALVLNSSGYLPKELLIAPCHSKPAPTAVKTASQPTSTVVIPTDDSASVKEAQVQTCNVNHIPDLMDIDTNAALIPKKPSLPTKPLDPVKPSKSCPNLSEKPRPFHHGKPPSKTMNSHQIPKPQKTTNTFKGPNFHRGPPPPPPPSIRQPEPPH
ncbi:hypothetical protein Ciccas_012649, partial [Cichlidogyrus casuarinus]